MKTLLLALFATVGLVRADDITLSDGIVLKDAKIVSHTSATVTILDSDGGGTFPMEKLSTDIQKRLGYTAASAADYRQKQVQAAAQGAEYNAYRKALSKYGLFEGRLVPLSVLSAPTMKVRGIGPGTVSDDVGNSLGAGYYCEVFRFVPAHNEYAGPISGGDSAGMTQVGLFTGPQPASNTTVVPDSWVDLGKAFIVGVASPISSDDLTEMVLVSKGTTQDGVPFYEPVSGFSIDVWRRAGSPQ